MRVLVTGGSGFIGTNLIDRLQARQAEILNLDLKEPLDGSHSSYWKKADILDGESITSCLRNFAPDVVIHLAARAECDESTTVEEGYRANTQGTANVLSAIRQTSVRQAIITSSQFVCGPGRLPSNDTDYFPHTIYGQSKVITEQLTRSANLDCTWTLIRPTNIWGPWHLRYAREFWKIASKGLYFHPAGKPVVRCYGYIGTVLDQIEDILQSPIATVNRRTLYVGDPPDDIYRWANAFCLALCGRKALRIPRFILGTAGVIGDGISLLTGRPFYITTSRFRSMVSDYITPMEPTYELLGKPRQTLHEGVDASTAWARSYWSRESGAPSE